MGSTTRQVSTALESTERGIDALWVEFKQTGAQTLRNQLIIYYSPFVKYVAGRVLAGLPRHFDEEDLVSYGIIGLIDAIERFEPDRNLRFETYAIPRIKGAIIDELRSIDWVPRSVRTKARAVEQAFTHLEGTLRRTPNESEVAAELEMTVGEFHKALRKISSVGMMALDEVLRGGERSERSTLGETLPDGGRGPVDTFEAKEAKEALVQAVDGMPERERTVLMMYYYDGLTLTEIGDVLGVTESRVCQIHTKALRQLRSKLADRPESTGRVSGSAGALIARWRVAATGRLDCSCSPAEVLVDRDAAGPRRGIGLTTAIASGSVGRYGGSSAAPSRQEARHALAQEGVRTGGDCRFDLRQSGPAGRPPVEAVSHRRDAARSRRTRRSPTSCCSTATHARTWPRSARPGRSRRSTS